jgi:S-formylglutathione hydrolase FrmB
MRSIEGCTRVALVAAVSFAASCIGDPDDTGMLDEPVTSSDGITVLGERWIDPRTLEVDISTALIAPFAVNGPHRIRITLPIDYGDNTAIRYPVVYLLHGGAGGNSAQWTTGGGVAEWITDGRPVITVMADGGKVGWFTNWVGQAQGPQRWADFYLTQVVPWIDHNFRTVAERKGRAIAGLSMGGYGAVRLAQDRPDLFASVASFSGAVDLGDLGTRTVITEQALQHGFDPYGPFGSPFWPSHPAWSAYDPMRRAARLAGMQVLLYAGAGIHDFDVLERTMGQSTDRFAKKLAAAGVAHQWWMYGRPIGAGCDGGHNFGCWNFAFDDALPKMLSALQIPAVPIGANLVANPGFERGQATWRRIGNGGNRCQPRPRAHRRRKRVGAERHRLERSPPDVDREAEPDVPRHRVDPHVGQQPARLRRSAHAGRAGRRRAALLPARQLHPDRGDGEFGRIEHARRVRRSVGERRYVAPARRRLGRRAVSSRAVAVGLAAPGADGDGRDFSSTKHGI